MLQFVTQREVEEESRRLAFIREQRKNYHYHNKWINKIHRAKTALAKNKKLYVSTRTKNKIIKSS